MKTFPTLGCATVRVVLAGVAFPEEESAGLRGMALTGEGLEKASLADAMNCSLSADVRIRPLDSTRGLCAMGTACARSRACTSLDAALPGPEGFWANADKTSKAAAGNA